MSTLPLYAKSLGGSDAEVGLVMGIFTMASLTGRILVGPFLDRWGRKWLYVSGTTIFLLSTLSYNFTMNVGSLLMMRLIHGLGFAVMSTAGATMIADFAPVQRRAEALSYYGMFTLIAMSLLPGVGLSLLGVSGLPFSGYPLVFTFAGLLAAIALIMAAAVREPYRGKHVTLAAASSFGIAKFVSLEVMPTALAVFFVAMSYGALTTFLPLYATGDNASNVAAYFFVYAVVVFTLRPFSGIASDRLGRRPVVIPSMVLAALGVSLLAISPSLPVVVITAIVYGLGFGSLYPGLLALAIDTVEPDKRGEAMGTFLATFDLGLSAGAIVLGIVAQVAGFGITFLVAGGCCLTGCAYFVLLPRLSRKPPPFAETSQIHHPME